MQLPPNNQLLIQLPPDNQQFFDNPETLAPRNKYDSAEDDVSFNLC